MEKKQRRIRDNGKRYKVVHQDGLNVLVETAGSKAKTEKRRFLLNVCISAISAVSAIVAAVFTALTYINS